jgi:cytochrome c1
MQNNMENLTTWLRAPQDIKPGCHMPNLDLTKEEVHYLVTYLETLK